MASSATHSCVFVCDESPGLSGAAAETSPVVVGSGEKPKAIVPRVSSSASASASASASSSVTASVSHTPVPSSSPTPTSSLMGTASPVVIAAGVASAGTESGDDTAALPSWAQGFGVLCAIISTVIVLVCMYGAVSRQREQQRRRRVPASVRGRVVMDSRRACDTSLARIVVHACATLVWLWSTAVHHHMATDSTTAACSRVSPWLMWVCGESLATALLCFKLAASSNKPRGGGASVMVRWRDSARATRVWVAAATIVGSAVVLTSGLSINTIVDRSLVENEDCSETAVASVGIGSMLLLHVAVVWVVLLALGRDTGGRFVGVLSTCTAFAGTFLWWALTYGGEEASTGHHTLTVVSVCAVGAALFGTRLTGEEVAEKVRPLRVGDAPVSPLQEEAGAAFTTTGRSSVACRNDDESDDPDGVKRWTMPDVPRLDLSATRPVPPVQRCPAQDESDDSDFDLLECMPGATTARATGEGDDSTETATQFPDVTPRGPLVVSSSDDDDDDPQQPQQSQQRRYQRPPTRRPQLSGLGPLKIRRGAALPLTKVAPPDILSLSDPVVIAEEEDHRPVAPTRQDLLQRTSSVVPAQTTTSTTASEIMSLGLMTTVPVERPLASPWEDMATGQVQSSSLGEGHDADGIVFLGTSRPGATVTELRLETLDDDDESADVAATHHHSGVGRVTRRRRATAAAAVDDEEDLLPGAISDKGGRLFEM